MYLEPLSSEGAPLSQRGVAIILDCLYPQVFQYKTGKLQTPAAQPDRIQDKRDVGMGGGPHLAFEMQEHSCCEAFPAQHNDQSTCTKPLLLVTLL